MIYGIRGVSSDVRALADRFADGGHIALAPDLLTRGGRIVCVVRAIEPLFSGSGPAIDTIGAARDYLMADERCAGKIAVAGSSFGGSLALVVAPSGQLDAAASQYGIVLKDPGMLEKSCPVVAGFGARGGIVKAGSAAVLDDALTSHDVPRH
ncbi:hypothetical protein MAUB_58760 [Mycolicibacterium aubagnense]|uniref:Dienelactone hydrolase domain-containing protein n=1 Tax=Mycolicibacterium aubagnense TaxID=319707 RepID=A0ABM7IMG2_9MYCO|nr:hypothetical protein MAUB_58760 [Mycolicibacterium aubagnense]